MEKIPARTGWLWLKQGAALFRKQPAEMSTLFLGYMFFMFAIGIVPVLGQILPLVLVPVFSIAFMQACRQIDEGKKVLPNVLISGFRSPAFKRLLILGALYFLAALAAVAASVLVDDGTFFKVMTGQQLLDAQAVRNSDMSQAMLLSAVLYTPALMGFWYAAPLIAWQNMGVGKAIFYSFFAVHRAGRAFLVYGLAWAVVGVLLPVIFSTLVALLFGTALVTIVILLPLTLIMTVVMYCSFYPMYTDIFGKPGVPEAPAAPTDGS